MVIRSDFELLNRIGRPDQLKPEGTVESGASRTTEAALPAIQKASARPLINGSLWDWFIFKFFASDAEKRERFNGLIEKHVNATDPAGKNAALQEIALMINRGYEPNVIYLSITSDRIAFHKDRYEFHQNISKHIEACPNLDRLKPEEKEKILRFFSMTALTQSANKDELLKISKEMLSYADSNDSFLTQVRAVMEDCSWATRSDFSREMDICTGKFCVFGTGFNRLFRMWNSSCPTDFNGGDPKKFVELNKALSHLQAVSAEAFSDANQYYENYFPILDRMIISQSTLKHEIEEYVSRKFDCWLPISEGRIIRVPENTISIYANKLLPEGNRYQVVPVIGWFDTWELSS